MGKGQRDIWRMDSVEDGDWFGTNVSNVLGGVKDIRFWKQKWIRMLGRLYSTKALSIITLRGAGFFALGRKRILIITGHKFYTSRSDFTSFYFVPRIDKRKI
jgi:hypothetical protein